MLPISKANSYDLGGVYEASTRICLLARGGSRNRSRDMEEHPLANHVMGTRRCPACDCDGKHTVMALEARHFCATNHTYRKDFETILGIPATARFPIVECASCDFLYAGLLLPAEFLSLVYAEVIDPEIGFLESTNHDWVAHQLHLAELLLTELSLVFGPQAPLRLLDFGCGYGTLVRALSNSRTRCVGYESGQRQLEYLAESALAFADSIDAVRNEAPFHGIILSDVLEHVPTPRETLRVCQTLLHEGGVICVNVPNFAAPVWRQQMKLWRNGGAITRSINSWEHLNYFSPTSLRAMIEGEGFRVLQPSGSIDVGLRLTHNSPLHRWGNFAKSTLRLLKSGLSGAVPPSTLCLAQVIRPEGVACRD